AQTLKNIETIAAMQRQYFNMTNRIFGTFDQQIKEKVPNERFAGNPPITDGYVFTLKVVGKSSSAPSSFTLNADPQSDDTGKNHFFIDSNDSNIRYNKDQMATASDAPFGG